MSTALRSKLGSLTRAGGRLLRSTVARSFSDCPQEPDRPLINQSRFSPNSNQRQPPKTKAVGAETDADFLEKFKLGLDKDGSKEKPNKTEAEGEDSAEPPLPSSPRDAEEIFKEMKQAGLIPNAVAMLDGLCKDGMVQEAMKLFGLMREKGSMPEVVVYTAVVEGFCKAHKLDDAIRVFKKMESNGVVANAFSYQVLIRGLCACGGKERFEEAYEFTMEMLEAGHSPNLGTFVGLIDGYCREKGLEEAKSVIKAMRAKGFFFEEKAVKEFLDKKGPFLPLVWEAILGKKKPSSSKTSSF